MCDIGRSTPLFCDVWLLHCTYYTYRRFLNIWHSAIDCSVQIVFIRELSHCIYPVWKPGFHIVTLELVWTCQFRWIWIRNNYLTRCAGARFWNFCKVMNYPTNGWSMAHSAALGYNQCTQLHPSNQSPDISVLFSWYLYQSLTKDSSSGVHFEEEHRHPHYNQICTWHHCTS